MYGVLIFIHLVMSVVLILLVLVQQPQKGGMTTILGGGDSVFGGGGAAPFMAKLTGGIAAAFMITSLALVLMAARTNRPVAAPRSTPTQPVPAPTQPQQPGPLGN